MCKVQGWKVEGGIEMGMGGILIGLGDSGCAWGGLCIEAVAWWARCEREMSTASADRGRRLDE
jgi:hypothetical protein